MSADQPPTNRRVAPLDVDAVRTVQIGTVLWVAGLVATLLMRDTLAEQGRSWWAWTCVAGVALGLLGLVVTSRRRRIVAVERSATQRS
ncbi:MAG: DUF2530 domain-containing protein [Actinomycetia bacterium]|nr:DUF2530 domain-containing protein [Actinomycetes bacterium]